MIEQKYIHMVRLCIYEWTFTLQNYINLPTGDDLLASKLRRNAQAQIVLYKLHHHWRSCSNKLRFILPNRTSQVSLFKRKKPKQIWNKWNFVEKWNDHYFSIYFFIFIKMFYGLQKYVVLNISYIIFFVLFFIGSKTTCVSIIWY